MKKQILAISGSTKRNSSNNTILRYIRDKYVDFFDVDIYEEIEQLPHFNPDLDSEEPPMQVAALRKRIQRADGILFCTPEYIFSLPGSLKNVIEWNVSTTLFSNKPVATIVAAASGEKALESLVLILTTIEARTSPGATLLIKGVKGKVSADGRILNKQTTEHLHSLITSFMTLIQEENALPTKYTDMNI